MNPFDFWFFFVLMGGLTATLKLWFFQRFADCKPQWYGYAVYLILAYCVEAASQGAQSRLLSMTGNLLLLVGIGWILLKARLPSAALTAVLAEGVALLAFGLLNSVFSILSPLLFSINPGMGLYVGMSSALLPLLFAFVCFQVILKHFSFDKAVLKQYLMLFLLPILLVLLASQYLSSTFYGSVIVMESSGVLQPGVNHWLMLSVQGLAGLLLFTTLYGCQKLSEGFAAQTRLALLEQETATQRDYLRETRSRYQQTQAFRHDIKGHLTALYGLLEQGELQSAREYLGKLDAVSDTLSFPCKTGNTVVDILLGGKLGAARQDGIRVECTIRIPSPCRVDDLDLCVLFSNAVDNAVRACGQEEDRPRYIRISGRQQGGFFLVEIENSCATPGGYQKGIGLSNIQGVAEKYQGAVTTEKSDDTFLLRVLLVLRL